RRFGELRRRISRSAQVMNCKGLLVATTLILLHNHAASAQSNVRLRESFSVDYAYHVSSRAELTGLLNLPPNMQKDKGPKTLPLSGSTTVEYDERGLEADADSVRKTVRIYSRMNYRRKVGEQLQESQLRPEIRRMVLLHAGNTEVPFSPDGPLLFSEIDMV